MPLPQMYELFYGIPLTDEQKQAVDDIFDYHTIFINAPAGTGKNTIAIGCADIIVNGDIPEFKHIDGMIYTFNPTEEDKLGYTKGNEEEKESKYLGPLKGTLTKLGIDHRFAIKRESHPPHINDQCWIDAKSHTFMRGHDYENKVVVVDEAQNFDKKSLKKLLTRLHDSCIVIVIGHDGQIDLKKPSESGFVPYIEWYKDKPYARFPVLTEDFRGERARHADKMPC